MIVKVRVCGLHGQPAQRYELRTPTATVKADMCATCVSGVLVAFAEAGGTSVLGGTETGMAWVRAAVVDHGRLAPHDDDHPGAPPPAPPRKRPHGTR